MNSHHTMIAQAIAIDAGLSQDDAMFFQSVPTALLAALARDELEIRGMDATGRWVGFKAAASKMG